MNTTLTNKAFDFADIDWNEYLKKIKSRKHSQKRHGGKEYWNRRAPSFADHAGKSFYPNAFIKIMDPQPWWTVLDIGCGGGTLAIPLAFRVAGITAVDFSEKMIEILRGETERRKIKNINAIKASWEDDWDEYDIGTHDVAIASRSLAVEDIKAAIIKLNKAAKKKVIISTLVGDGPFDRGMFEAVGRELTRDVDYIYIYNLLYQMGIYANISFIVEETAKTYESPEAAFDSMRWMFQDMTAEEEMRLNIYLKDHLINKDDKLVMDYKKAYKWAVLWWDKEN